MAVRFDASGEHYIRTAGGFLTTTAFTVCLWAVVDVDRNATNALWGMRGTASGDYIYLYNANGDGTTQVLEMAGGIGATGPSMTVGTWYFLAAGRSGTGGSQTFLGYGTPGGALTWVTGSLTVATGTLNEETIGTNGFAPTTGWFNGRVAALKVWSAALTQAQLEAERFSMVPLTLANLFAWRPFLQGGSGAGALADWSGLGRTLTGGASSTTEDGPPIAWTTWAGWQGRRAASTPPVTPLGGRTLMMMGVGF